MHRSQGESHGNVRILHRFVRVPGERHRLSSQVRRLQRQRPVGPPPDKTSTRDFAHETSTKAPEGAVVGAGTGGLVGGALGLLAGIGLLAIPGVGPFIAAGPIMAALSGIAAGAAVGGITGALIGMGIPEIQAKRYEGKVRGGNILISAHSESAAEIARAKDIFEKAGATDIGSTSEKTAPAVTTVAPRESARL